MRLTDKEFFAKGKRGETYIARLDGKRVLVKEHNPDAAIDTIANEAEMQQRLNSIGIGPKFFAYDKKRNRVIREFIDGEEIKTYLPKASKKEALRVLGEMFLQCRRMDLLGINKFELVRPLKHIIITTKRRPGRPKGSVVQIDFERCKESEHPKNVTQFAEFCRRGFVASILKKHKIMHNDDKLIELMKSYKKKYKNDDFEALLKGILRFVPERSFQEKVWEACWEIPEGKVSTYGDLARKLGVNSAQAIGQALKRNPYAPRVPCHRVVAREGSIGGFAGARTGKPIKNKIALLKKEGVKITDGHIATFTEVHHA